MPECLNILIEKIEGDFFVSFVGDLEKKLTILKYPANETMEVLKSLIYFHSEENGSICEELEKIMSLVLNEGIKIGKGDEKMVNVNEEEMNQREKDRQIIMDLLKKANPNKVTANELGHLEYEIKELAAQFLNMYDEYPVPKGKCDHPDFADIDCDEYNYCKLCGRSWDV